MDRPDAVPLIKLSTGHVGDKVISALSVVEGFQASRVAAIPHVRQWGQFGRQFYRIAVETGDCTRVYVLPDLDLPAYKTIEAPTS